MAELKNGGISLSLTDISMFLWMVCGSNGVEEIKNVSVLIAVGIDEHGYRTVLGVAEGCMAVSYFEEQMARDDEQAGTTMRMIS